MIELLVVVAITLVLAALTIPNTVNFMRSYRGASNARSIASQLSFAKMDAARDFTQSQMKCNLAGNTCQLQICTIKGPVTCTTYTNEGGPITLSNGISFGFGSITTPAGTQTTISNTSPIMFNSRGIPIDNTATLTGNDAIYISDTTGKAYAISVYATGRVAVWQYLNNTWTAL